MTKQGIKGRSIYCYECGTKVFVMLGNTYYPNARGRRCWRRSLISENEATVVGFSRKWEGLIIVRFEGQKSMKSVAFSHFHQCKKKGR